MERKTVVRIIVVDGEAGTVTRALEPAWLPTTGAKVMGNLGVYCLEVTDEMGVMANRDALIKKVINEGQTAQLAKAKQEGGDGA